MSRMKKGKRRLLFEGAMQCGTKGFTSVERLDERGTLVVANSSFGFGRMVLTPKQAVALRKFLEETE